MAAYETSRAAPFGAISIFRFVQSLGEVSARFAAWNDARVTRKTLSKLTDRERRVIEARKLQDDPATLDDLSQEFGVSRERIRQIEVRAFEKLQKAVKNAAQKALAPKAQALAAPL